MLSLSDFITLVKLLHWVFPKAKRRFRKQRPVRVLLPSWMDEETQSHWQRINSWDDIRKL